MTTPIHRKLVAEAAGTMFLVAAAIGSGIAASRLSPQDTGLQLLESAIATGAALTALILALQPVSAAFNPVITVIEAGEGTLGWGHAASAVSAQIAGGTLGAVIANLMFGLPAVSLATTARTGPGIWLAEVVATAGLVMVIGGTGRAGRADWTAFAVGGYITAAYWFTSSTSFANPAVTIARMLSDSFAGIAPRSVPVFLVAQIVGGAVGYFLNQSLYPRRRFVGADLRTDEAVDAPQQHQGRGQHEPH